jgi:ThiF family
VSAKPTAPDSAYGRLRAEGYEVEVREQHLLVHAVPCVTACRAIERGTLVCTYVESAGLVQTPDNHQVWWTGSFPCRANGTPLAALRNEDGASELLPGITIQHRFSNKPEGLTAFAEHYAKMVHYVNLLSDQARVIDPTADARTGRVIELKPEESVFRYADTASVRAEIMPVTRKFLGRRVSIVGLGGTGGYVFDQVAKTPVAEIHLFDGDEFKQHNAFRAPGAATIDELLERLPKVGYFRRRYDAMHRAITAHPYRITTENVAVLRGFDFVFVCVDKGPVRALIMQFLKSERIPFVDVGLSLDFVPETESLVGTCRVTASTVDQSDHLARYVPTAEDLDDELYGRNVQVADLNALNALLAVIKWKQLVGFYSDDFGAHHLTFSPGSMSLTRDVQTKVLPE